MTRVIFSTLFGLFLAGSAFAAEIEVNSTDLRDIGGGMTAAVGIGPRLVQSNLPVVDEGWDFDGARVLADLTRRGVANGFAGVLYDNRDRAHSLLDARRFPALNSVRYGFELTADNLDIGAAARILFPAVVIGNSSTAVTHGAEARSLARLAMSTAQGVAASVRHYRANHLYVYPEHRDHDDYDLFSINWPYTVQSQGSSFSDRPFYEALLATVAGFRPDTFDRLRQEGLIAPTLQMILRRNLAIVPDRDAYFTGVAHSVAIDGAHIRGGRMVGHANAIRPDDIPPLVTLSVEEETFERQAGLLSQGELLFNTPSAVARIWRSWDYEKSVILSAADTQDPNGRPLSFTWSLLQGDPNLVDIEPLDEAGTRARVTLRWHEPYSANGADRLTARVDVGAFASNGVHDSAPAFFTVSFPAHEKRVYDNAARELVSIDYSGAEGRLNFMDPRLHWIADWSDEAIRDDSGVLTGWIRRHGDGREERVAILPDQNAASVEPDGLHFRLRLRAGE